VTKGSTIRLDLHEALLKQPYEHGVVCTFGFDPSFFEKECLDKLRALSRNGNLTVLVDRGVYDEMVGRSGGERPTLANLRYLLHPVAPAGKFHPKIFLFASSGRGRMIFGSANFTRKGLHSNAELACCFDYEEGEDESMLCLFRSAFAFIRRVGDRWPAENLKSNLDDMEAEAQWLSAEEEGEGDDYEFLHNLDEPLWDQIVSRVTAPVETLSVVSRYFDKSPAIIDKLYNRLKPKRIKIFTQNNTTTLTAEYLEHPLVKKGTVEIYLCAYKDVSNKKEQSQRLHAKALAVETPEETLLAFGSANCTSPGLLRTADNGNVETMLLLRGLTKRSLKVDKLFDPEQTAARLRDMESLQTDKRKPPLPPVRREITLCEVNLETKTVKIRAVLPDSLSYDRLEAVFTLPNDTEVSIAVSHLHEEWYGAGVSEELFRTLTEGTSVARMVALADENQAASSNGLFVTHLQDVRTGRSLRRVRALKEAEQSPAKFDEVYWTILEEGGEETARNFLDTFNVHVTDLPGATIFRAVRPVWERDRAFMMIRGRTWTPSDDIHDAVLKFFDRHYKRLGRHVENRSPDGIENFMHILLTTAVVLKAQIEQAVEGLRERAERPLRPEEWARQRDRLASYYRRHKELLQRLTHEYLLPMSKKYPAAEIREGLIPDAEALRSLTARFFQLHDQLEGLRLGKLRVESISGRLAVPPLFSSLFNEKEWPKYEHEINVALNLADGIGR
jgi:hypothetical protein